MKHQNPKSKHQRSTNPQISIGCGQVSQFVFGIWNFFGVWCLVFGV
jgi:hypothetical protein